MQSLLIPRPMKKGLNSSTDLFLRRQLFDLRFRSCGAPSGRTMKSLTRYISFENKMTGKKRVIITNKAVTSRVPAAATMTKLHYKSCKILACAYSSLLSAFQPSYLSCPMERIKRVG